MFGTFPLIPAYGRDYQSAEAVTKDFLEGKDFLTIQGQYCSARDFPTGEVCPIRYAKLRKATSVTVPAKKLGAA